MLEIPTKLLLLLGGAAWLAAGLSVTSVGITASHGAWSGAMIIALIIVFLLFLAMFLRISLKHAKRILGYTERLTSAFKFFDANSYIIMAVMIGLGVAVRLSGLVPDPGIASFYTGLGSALLICALFYLVTYVAVCDILPTKSITGSE
jgi:hypothetical protein